MDLDEEVRAMGRRLKQIRESRGMSLEVLAGLAGASKGHLSRIERGERALDSLKLTKALADALRISPEELTRLPVPAPGNGNTDATIEAVRLAFDAVDLEHPGGLVCPVDVLRERVLQIEQQSRACRFADVAADLPGLIRDLHSTLDTGRDHGELLALAVYLHVHLTRMWLANAGAPADLRRRVVFLARRLAREHGEGATLGMAVHGVTGVLLHSGAFDLAQAELDSLTLPPTTRDTAGLVCAFMANHALAAFLTGQSGNADAPMETAVEVAARFGELPGDPLGFAFGPTSVEFRRIELALERGEPDGAVRVAEQVNPQLSPFPTRRVAYWASYGRALSQLRGRRDDAVRALRTAEEIFPIRVYRNQRARETITALLERPPVGRAGQELRGLASRAGLTLTG